MDERLKDEVLAAFAAYLAAFLARDKPALDEMMQYPLTYIGDGASRQFDSFPFDPAKMMAAKQMHTTIDADYEAVMVTGKKAHVVLRSATRVRKDGSPIETVSGFYALTRTESGWKFFALSDITIPVA
ncbi:MAG: hypothetical protein ACOY17_06710 [Pseudomonadota bacterium]|jgi:hypothetical protein